jgi:hypothetical protein
LRDGGRARVFFQLPLAGAGHVEHRDRAGRFDRSRLQYSTIPAPGAGAWTLLPRPRSSGGPLCDPLICAPLSLPRGMVATGAQRLAAADSTGSHVPCVRT